MWGIAKIPHYDVMLTNLLFFLTVGSTLDMYLKKNFHFGEGPFGTMANQRGTGSIPNPSSWLRLLANEESGIMWWWLK